MVAVEKPRIHILFSQYLHEKGEALVKEQFDAEGTIGRYQYVWIPTNLITDVPMYESFLAGQKSQLEMHYPDLGGWAHVVIGWDDVLDAETFFHSRRSAIILLLGWVVKDGAEA